MIKVAAITALAIATAIIVTVPTTKETAVATIPTTESVELESRKVDGRFYVDEFVTNNGDVFIYDATFIDGIPAYDGMPVWAMVSNNGTETIEDDIILSLHYNDVQTVHDELVCYDLFGMRFQ